MGVTVEDLLSELIAAREANELPPLDGEHEFTARDYAARAGIDPERGRKELAKLVRAGALVTRWVREPTRNLPMLAYRRKT